MGDKSPKQKKKQAGQKADAKTADKKKRAAAQDLKATPAIDKK